jgi:hypothetical protein
MSKKRRAGCAGCGKAIRAGWKICPFCGRQAPPKAVKRLKVKPARKAVSVTGPPMPGSAVFLGKNAAALSQHDPQTLAKVRRDVANYDHPDPRVRLAAQDELGRLGRGGGPAMINSVTQFQDDLRAIAKRRQGIPAASDADITWAKRVLGEGHRAQTRDRLDAQRVLEHAGIDPAQFDSVRGEDTAPATARAIAQVSHDRDVAEERHARKNYEARGAEQGPSHPLTPGSRSRRTTSAATSRRVTPRNPRRLTFPPPPPFLRREEESSPPSSSPVPRWPRGTPARSWMRCGPTRPG